MKKSNMYILTFFLLLSMHKPSSAYTLVFISIPKCGTNLTIKLIEMLTGWNQVYLDEEAIKYPKKLSPLQENQFYSGHIRATSELVEHFSKPQFKGIFIQRNPRDGLVSLLHFIPKMPHLFGSESQLTFHQLFDIKVKSYFKYVLQFAPWRSIPNFLTICFEDLVGSKGGGSDFAQRETICAVARHLEIDITPEQLEYSIKNLFGGTYTFRKGQIGAWKTELTATQKSTMSLYDQQALEVFEYGQ